jgi:heme/copper-type cytochrome/quinol oxidase subunit 4
MGHYTTGILIVLALAVLTAIEFWVALVTHSVVFLMLIAAFKAILVIWFFMHVKRLWAPDGGH